MNAHIILIVGILAFVLSGCAMRAVTVGQTYELGVAETVQTKGSYESAAYCFSREYRHDRNPVLQGQMTPIVEIDPSQDYAELLFWGGPANWNMMVVKFFGTDDGNSMAEIYVSTYLKYDYLGSREKYARDLVADTKKCQLEEGAEIK